MPIPMRVARGVLVAGAMLSLIGCNDDREQAAKLAEVQRIADERLKKSERAAAEKVQGLEKQVESLRSELETQAAKLKSEAEQAIGKAQADAEEQTKQAEAALKKARDAYKAEGRTELAQLSRQVQELSAKSAKAPPKVKAAVQKSMQDVAKQQQLIGKDIAAFDKAALDQLGVTKAKLARDMAKLKQLVANMKAKLG